MTCLHYDKSEIDKFAKILIDEEIQNILALRGDKNPSIQEKGVFKHASDLITYLKSKHDFCFLGACYPECHPEAPNMDTDIRHLKEKVDAGASHLITQLFFDNDSFYDFRYRAARAGVNVPIEAGIMPVTNRKQIERMVTMCGASLPRKFTKMVQRFEDNPDALRDAGIAYAIDQIVDLVTDGVDGIHLYTMNNPYVARKISEAVGGIIKAATKC